MKVQLDSIRSRRAMSFEVLAQIEQDRLSPTHLKQQTTSATKQLEAMPEGNQLTVPKPFATERAKQKKSKPLKLVYRRDPSYLMLTQPIMLLCGL
jgi:conjugal transfer/entry exclusion protein